MSAKCCVQGYVRRPQHSLAWKVAADAVAAWVSTLHLLCSKLQPCSEQIAWLYGYWNWYFAFDCFQLWIDFGCANDTMIGTYAMWWMIESCHFLCINPGYWYILNKVVIHILGSLPDFHWCCVYNNDIVACSMSVSEPRASCLQHFAHSHKIQ